MKPNAKISVFGLHMALHQMKVMVNVHSNPIFHMLHHVCHWLQYFKIRSCTFWWTTYWTFACINRAFRIYCGCKWGKLISKVAQYVSLNYLLKKWCVLLLCWLCTTHYLCNCIIISSLLTVRLSAILVDVENYCFFWMVFWRC